MCTFFYKVTLFRSNLCNAQRTLPVKLKNAISHKGERLNDFLGKINPKFTLSVGTTQKKNVLMHQINMGRETRQLFHCRLPAPKTSTYARDSDVTASVSVSVLE